MRRRPPYVLFLVRQSVDSEPQTADVYVIRPEHLVVSSSVGGIGSQHGPADRSSLQRSANYEPHIGAVQPSFHLYQLAFLGERGCQIPLELARLRLEEMQARA